MKKIDLNKEYGNWKILEYSHTKKSIDYYKCMCKCGNIKTVNIYNLITGRSTNCGCLRKEKMSKNRIKDLTGKKIGKLTIIRRLNQNSKNNKVVYECLCECGTVKNILANSILTGHTISCGCVVSKYPSIISNIIKNKFGLDCIKEYYIDLSDLNLGIKNIRFDIFIPKLNIAIEYDGEQHFIPINYSNNINSLELLKITQYRDKIKNEYCAKNNIPLLRIPYYSKDIMEEIITNFISAYND